ncbi:ester cyclase [Steroidobacter cummioxidans]|uniref:ester cyclase n=1 Tax=Steroidobacter cummioxidans TaxID=1803913 RepID=UPI000E311EFF|nr:ester cyclase [Steroidobacter cummioxidans]
MNKFVALMRRYVCDYTNRHDFSVCDEIMVPNYTLHMGTYNLSGRDTQYKPATNKQFQQFPGLGLTVNQIVTNGSRLCMRFSEHGASMRHDGALASWGGIGLYKWDGERLTENFVEQDYYSRREQLASGRPKPVETPALAPWDTVAEPANNQAETVVRDVLQHRDLTEIENVVCDDAWTGSPLQRVLRPQGATIDDLFSAGEQVAFRIKQTGTLLEDFAGAEPRWANRPVFLHMTGLVTVRDGRIVAGRVIRDRLGLLRRLQAA